MAALIFIAVIVALIVVHEFGHFVVAKLSGMRVDEFGLGYPPRALTIGKWGGTEYTLNWLPFGGFVKIYGEDGEDAKDPRAFGARPRILQALVLVAGIAMNLVFAYVLITGALVSGTPRALAPNEVSGATSVHLAVADVLPGSPAARAGVAAGDVILSAKSVGGKNQASPTTTFSGTDPAQFGMFVEQAGSNATVKLLIRNTDGSESTLSAHPVAGLVPGDPSRYALGVEVATIGIVPLSLGEALAQGVELTWGATVLTAQGLWHFFSGVFTLSASLSQVSGPIGIAGIVGNASAQGLGSLLSIVAIISINLALINLIPIPALDGGRLLFVFVEGVIRRPIKPSVARAFNTVGFAFLIILMVVVSAHDIAKLIS